MKLWNMNLMVIPLEFVHLNLFPKHLGKKSRWTRYQWNYHVYPENKIHWRIVGTWTDPNTRDQNVQDVMDGNECMTTKNSTLKPYHRMHTYVTPRTHAKTLQNVSSIQRIGHKSCFNDFINPIFFYFTGTELHIIGSKSNSLVKLN